MFSVAWGFDGTVASGSKDKTIKLWNTEVSACRTSPGTQGKFLTTTPSAFSKQLFLCMLTDLNDFSDVNTVTFSPDAKSLASGSDDKTVKIWGASLDK